MSWKVFIYFRCLGTINQKNIPLLSMCDKDYKSIYQRDICTSVFIGVLVTLAKFWNSLRYTLTNEWMYCHVLSIVVTKCHDPKQLKTKCSSSLQVIACYQGKPRQKHIAKTWGHRQKQKSWGSAAYWLLHFLSLLLTFLACFLMSRTTSQK